MFVSYFQTDAVIWDLYYLGHLTGRGTRPLDCNASIWFVPGTMLVD